MKKQSNNCCWFSVLNKFLSFPRLHIYVMNDDNEAFKQELCFIVFVYSVHFFYPLPFSVSRFFRLLELWTLFPCIHYATPDIIFVTSMLQQPNIPVHWTLVHVWQFPTVLIPSRLTVFLNTNYLNAKFLYAPSLQDDWYNCSVHCFQVCPFFSVEWSFYERNVPLW